MPLLQQKILGHNAELGIWQIEESEEWFLDNMRLSPTEAQQLSQIKGTKRKEWLAVRYLLHYLSGRKERGALVKDEFGKPFLDQSNFYISISHSHQKAAAIAAPISCGIDIQKIVPKISRIQHKFMLSEDIQSLSKSYKLEQMHVIWGAKEALYKAYGRKKIDFKAHLFISPFSFNKKGDSIKGYIHKGNIRQDYDIHYEMVDDFVLVYATLKKPTLLK